MRTDGSIAAKRDLPNNLIDRLMMIDVSGIQ
jgi:hypothetical protein